MKPTLQTGIIILFFTAVCIRLQAQNEPALNTLPQKFYGRVFSNFSLPMDNGNRSGAFELTRAYFGFEHRLNDHFTASVKLDVGSPNDLSEFSRLRRYAYFKNAGITYRNGALIIWGGLFDMVQFKEQENFWNYRYLYRSYLDEYHFGPSADLGAGVRYNLGERVVTDLVLSNGEGYSSPQRDDQYKAGWGLTFRPSDQLTLRSYYTVLTATTPEMTLTGFAGYNTGKYRIGAEYNHQLNNENNQGHSRFGYSIFSTWVFSDQWEVFFRYDQVFSNILPEYAVPWNLPNDGSAMVGGLQYQPSDFIRLALNYQDWVEYADNGDTQQTVFLHLEVNF